jgi:hypothetical protein
MIIRTTKGENATHETNLTLETVADTRAPATNPFLANLTGQTVSVTGLQMHVTRSQAIKPDLHHYQEGRYSSKLRMAACNYTHRCRSATRVLRHCARVHYDRRCESNASSFFSQNATAESVTFTRMIHTYFPIMRLFLPQSLRHFQHTFPGVQ